MLAEHLWKFAIRKSPDSEGWVIIKFKHFNHRFHFLTLSYRQTLYTPRTPKKIFRLNSFHHIRDQNQHRRKAKFSMRSQIFCVKFTLEKNLFCDKTEKKFLNKYKEQKVRQPQDDVKASQSEYWMTKWVSFFFVLVNVYAYLKCCLNFTNKFQYNFDLGWCIFNGLDGKGFEIFECPGVRKRTLTNASVYYVKVIQTLSICFIPRIFKGFK